MTLLERLFVVSFRIWAKLGTPAWFEWLIITPILKLSEWRKEVWTSPSLESLIERPNDPEFPEFNSGSGQR